MYQSSLYVITTYFRAECFMLFRCWIPDHGSQIPFLLLCYGSLWRIESNPSVHMSRTLFPWSSCQPPWRWTIHVNSTYISGIVRYADNFRNVKIRGKADLFCLSRFIQEIWRKHGNYMKWLITCLASGTVLWSLLTNVFLTLFLRSVGPKSASCGTKVCALTRNGCCVWLTNPMATIKRKHRNTILILFCTIITQPS